MAIWLVVYRGDVYGDGRPYDLVDADEVTYDGQRLLLTKQVLVLFEPRTVVVSRLALDELASLCLLRQDE